MIFQYLIMTFLKLPKVGLYNCVKTAPFHPNIHNLGNTGIGGYLHANLAEFSTTLIDQLAYNGEPIRRRIAREIAGIHQNKNVLELGCGVGTLTRELIETDAFPQITAIDTSREMITLAAKRNPLAKLKVQNGVDAYKYNTDLVITSFMMHEMPSSAHIEVIDSSLKAIEKNNGELWIVDIDLSYRPSYLMRLGEPYIMNYLSNFSNTIDSFQSRAEISTFTILEGHVRAWVLTHNSTKNEAI